MSKQKNAYLAKQAAKQAERELYVKLWTTQVCMDAFMLALNDPEFVGKDVFGKSRFNRIKPGIEKYYHEIMAGATNDVKASYVRHLVDDRLRAICGEYFEPWEVRYEDWDDRGI